MLHNYPLLASLEAYLAHHVSKKWWGIFDTCKAKYASHVTYCPSLEATLSHCVSYLTLCRDRFTVNIHGTGFNYIVLIDGIGCMMRWLPIVLCLFQSISLSIVTNTVYLISTSRLTLVPIGKSNSTRNWTYKRAGVDFQKRWLSIAVSFYRYISPRHPDCPWSRWQM